MLLENLMLKMSAANGETFRKSVSDPTNIFRIDRSGSFRTFMHHSLRTLNSSRSSLTSNSSGRVAEFENGSVQAQHMSCGDVQTGASAGDNNISSTSLQYHNHHNRHKSGHRSPDSSSSQQQLLQSAGSLKSKDVKFHKLFKNIPGDEHVVNSFSSAFVGDILLQGQMYVSKNWICFYSNIFGQKTQIQISVKSVISVSKEKTAFFIPNAVGINTEKERYVFGSFLSRDAAYKLLQEVCNASMHDKEIFSEEGGRLQDEESKSLSMLENDELEDDEGPESLSESSEHDILDSNNQHVPSSRLPDTSPVYVKLFHCLWKVASTMIREMRRSLIMLLAFLLMFTLLCSACVLAYRIVLVQKDFGELTTTSDFTTRYYTDIYNMNAHLHSASVTRMQTILDANMQLLDEVRHSLERLNGFVHNRAAAVQTLRHDET